MVILQKQTNNKENITARWRADFAPFVYLKKALKHLFRLEKQQHERLNFQINL